jgi:RNA polymerase sigma factor (sigma-70 family)
MKRGWSRNLRDYESLKRQFVLLKRYYPFYFDKFSSFDELREYFSKNLYSAQCDILLNVLSSALKNGVVSFEFLYVLFERGINKILFKYIGFPEKDDLEIFLFETFYKVILRFDFKKHSGQIALRILSKINKAISRYVEKCNLFQSKIVPLDEVELEESSLPYSLDLILSSLSDFEKELIIRRYVYSESLKDIAKSLNCSYSSVRQRIRRVIKRIKKNF